MALNAEQSENVYDTATGETITPTSSPATISTDSASAAASSVPSMSSAPPVLLMSQATRDFDRMGAENVAIQKGEVVQPSMDETFDTVLSSTTFDEINASGYPRIGNIVLDPDYLEQARQDTSTQAVLYEEFAKNYTVPEIEPQKVPVAFSSPDYKAVNLPAYFDKYPVHIRDKLTRMIEIDQSVASTLDQSSLPTEGKELLLNEFISGSLSSEIMRSWADLPSDLSQTLPTITGMGLDAYRAAAQAAGTWDDDRSFKDTFVNTYNYEQEQTYSTLKKYFYEPSDTLAFGLFRSAEQRLSRKYKELFIEKYSQEGWDAVHRKPAYENKFDENGEIVGVAYKYDEDGKLVYEDDVDPAVFSNLLAGSFDNLTNGEKALMFFSVDAPLMQFGVFRNTAKGQKWFDQVQAARTSNPDSFGRDMTDWQVHTAVTKKQYGAAFGTAILGVQRLLYGKASIDRGRTMNTHLSNLADMESTIKKLDTTLDEKRALQKTITNKTQIPDAELAADIQNLETEVSFLRSSQSSYRNKSGGGKYKNPLSKATLMDDVYISAALGYLPEYGGPVFEAVGLGEETGEVLTMIASPFIAPYTARKGLSGLRKAANKTPFIKMGPAAIQDLAGAMENANWLPLVTPGMLIRGEKAEIKAAAQAAGIELTDQNIESIEMFAKVLRSAKTDVDLGGGRRVNMQKKIYDSLVNYGDVMSRMKKRMVGMTDKDGNRAFTDDEVTANMGNLHLSLAHASGLAPLIALQHMQLKSLKPSSVLKEETLGSMFKQLLEEQSVMEGMDTQFKMLTASFASKGIKLDTNDPIQETIVMLGNVAEQGRDSLNLKKQELGNVIDVFIRDPAGVTAGQFETLVGLRVMEMTNSPADVIDRAKVAEQIAVDIQTAAQGRLTAVQRLSGDMTSSQVDTEVRTVAQTLFDVTLRLRKERGSARYANVNTYATDNSISIDMDELVAKMMSMDAELNSKDISFFFGGGKKFLSTDGLVLRDTFDSMAMRGLVERYGDEQSVIEAIQTAFKNGVITKESATEFAIFAAQKSTGAEAGAFKYFKGSVEEVEDVRRFFRDRAITNNNAKGAQAKAAAIIDSEFEEATDALFATADPTGKLSLMLDVARTGWRQDVGDVTETGTYAGTVVKGTKRDEIILDEAKTAETGELVTSTGNRQYINPSARPEKPFIDIAKSFRTIISDANPATSQDSILAIKANMQKLMQFYGAERVGGQYVFNLSDPKQKTASNLFATLLETQLNKEAQLQLSGMFGFATPEIKQTGIDISRELKVVQSASKQLGAMPAYDFSRGKRMLEVENELRIPVVKDKNSPVEYRNSHTTTLKGEFATVDELLEKSEMWKAGYEDIREQANNLDSPLRLAATREFEKEESAITNLENAKQNANDPSAFFKQNFETATPTSVQMLRDDLASAGLSAEDIDISLKAMYVNGLTQKAGHRFIKTSGFGDAKEEVQDVTVLIDHVNDPKKRDVMVAVLGEEHAKHLEDIASWAQAAIGDGAGFRAVADTRGMSIDSAIARFFNLSRGLVSPQYVIAEVGVRLMLKSRQELVALALADKGAAGVLGKMLQTPKAITEADLTLIGTRVRNYLLMGEGGILRNEGEIAALDIFLGATATETISEKQEKELRTMQEQLREQAEKLNQGDQDENEQ